MSILDKLKKASEVKFKSVSINHKFEGEDEAIELRFRIRPVSLGELMEAMDGYPRIYALIEGMAGQVDVSELEELLLIEQMKKATEYVEAFESLICIAAELETGEDEYLPFVMEPEGDEAVSPSILPPQVVIELGQAIVTSFRFATR